MNNRLCKMILIPSILCMAFFTLAGCGPDPVYKRKIEQQGNVYSKDNFIAQAAKGNGEAVAWYLKAGMRVNCRAQKGRERGRTALIAAARNGHLDVVKLLVEQGAAVEKETKIFRNISDNGETPLMAAAGKGYLEIVKYLHQKGAYLDRRGNITVETALLVAAHYGRFEVVKYLVEHGADLEIRRQGSRQSIYLAEMHGKTALHYAVDLKHKAMIQYLVEKGADINSPKTDGFTPLMTALFKGDEDVFKLLISLGADVDYQDKEGKSLLMHAILRGGDNYVDKVEQVINGGANLNLKDKKWGWTALMFAANKGYGKTVSLLLKHNADKGIKDIDGQTAMDIARNSKHETIADLLAE